MTLDGLAWHPIHERNAVDCTDKEPILAGLQRAFEHIDQYLEPLMQEANIPGMTVAVTNREHLLRASAYGVTDLGTQVPVEPNTLFEIGSLGKQFTSIALLQLRDEGVVDFHAPVSQYLPWLQIPSDYPPMTAHHLLNHTAGLNRGTDLAPHGMYEVWALRDRKVRTPPGVTCRYSNLGYKILGFVLEALTGQALHEVIRTRVLEPLGMMQTHPAMTHETHRQTATGYCDFYDDRPAHPSHGLAPAIWSEFATGDGCQVSTASDMATYLRMLLNRGRGDRCRIMSEASFNLMTQPNVWTGVGYYAYALATYTVDGRTCLGHAGGNAGYRSSVMIDLKTGFAVVILLNVTGDTEPINVASAYVLDVLFAARRKTDLPSPPPMQDASVIANAADYAGVYRAGNQCLQLTAEAEKLCLTFSGQVVELERRGEDQFYVGHPDLDLFLLEFRRHDGEVVEVFHGPDWYTNERYTGQVQFTYPEAWNTYTGHYRTRSPECSNFRIVLRKGNLVLIYPWGVAETLVELGDGGFRVGEDEHSPETLRFEAIVDGRALLAEYSGCPYYRAFTA
jgi:CubicO group peptidase (beta-lactamase class C family)